MPDFEDAFRQGFGRIDTMPSPLPPLDGAELAARAAAEQQRQRPRPNPARLLMAAAAVLLVVGVPVAVWLAWGSPQQPIPAEPVPTPTPSSTQLVIPPLTRTPSAHEVLLDDPALIHHEVAGVGGSPTGFFVGGDTITVPDEDNKGQVLSVYHGGERVDRLSLPYVPYGEFVVWENTYYLLSGTLRAFTRQGNELVETSLPQEVVSAGQLDRLVVEGENLVAVAGGKHYLVAGPGPLVAAPQLEIVSDGFTIADGDLDVRLQTGGEPIGVHLLGRDAEHVWYEAVDSRRYERAGSWYQSFVYQFSKDGRLTDTFTLDPRTRQVQVANGRVYALVVIEDQAVVAKDTVQVWELEPNLADAVAASTDPAEECDLILLGVDPIACTQPTVTDQPIAPLASDPDFYILSVADGRIRCDIDGRGNLAACATDNDLEIGDRWQCEQGKFDPNYLEFSTGDSGGSGCRTGQLQAEQQQPPVLPEGALLTAGELTVLAGPYGITIWNHASGTGLAISGERVQRW